MGIWDNNAGAPGKLIAYNGNEATNGAYLHQVAGTDGTARWVEIPIGKYLTAATYWIGFVSGNPTSLNIHKDASGTDQYWTVTIADITDAVPGTWALTTSTDKYSIRASVLT